MAEVITIPQKYIKERELVLIPRIEYEELLKLQKKRCWEEEDTNEAIKVFRQEKKKGKLIKIKSLAEID